MNTVTIRFLTRLLIFCFISLVLQTSNFCDTKLCHFKAEIDFVKNLDLSAIAEKIPERYNEELVTNYLTTKYYGEIDKKADEQFHDLFSEWLSVYGLENKANVIIVKSDGRFFEVVSRHIFIDSKTVYQLSESSLVGLLAHECGHIYSSYSGKLASSNYTEQVRADLIGAKLMFACGEYGNRRMINSLYELTCLKDFYYKNSDSSPDVEVREKVLLQFNLPLIRKNAL